MAVVSCPVAETPRTWGAIMMTESLGRSEERMGWRQFPRVMMRSGLRQEIEELQQRISGLQQHTDQLSSPLPEAHCRPQAMEEMLTIWKELQRAGDERQIQNEELESAQYSQGEREKALSAALQLRSGWLPGHQPKRSDHGSQPGLRPDL